MEDSRQAGVGWPVRSHAHACVGAYARFGAAVAWERTTAYSTKGLGSAKRVAGLAAVAPPCRNLGVV